MRVAGATAKQMLLSAAAEAWDVNVTSLRVSQSMITHEASGKQATFGELARSAAKQPMPDVKNLRLKQPEDFTLIGRPMLARKDVGKTDGSAIFTQDIQLEGMLTALVAHSPVFGGVLASFDDKAARKIAGVVDVVAIPTGVAVLAKDFWSAKKGRDALTIEWDESQALKKSSATLMAEYKALSAEPGKVARNDGDVETALAQAATVIEAEFAFPYLAHAAMEPMNCVARVDKARCDIWNGAQLQTGDQYAVASLLNIPPENVHINMVYAGGSFGRRANPQSDYILEAVNIARAKPSVPVKLVWTREDDMRQGYYRPMYYHKIRGGLDEKGTLVAWQQRIVGQSIAEGTAFEKFLVKEGVDNTSVEGAANLPYSVPHINVDLHTVSLPVPVQWWRAVGHTHTAFSTEVFLDHVANASKQDPVALRMQLLKGHARHQGVLKLAAEKAGWGRDMPKDRALGVAVHESFNSFVAEVAEVSLQANGQFRVEKVTCAVDCGIAVNPDIIKAQMEGGIGFGLAATLLSEITLEEGRTVQSNFHDYQVLRMDQMPEIDVHIVPSAEPPTGVGEPGTPPIAAAVANALFALTGQVFDQLPLRLKA